MGEIITIAEARKNVLKAADEIEKNRRKYITESIIDTGDTVKHIPTDETWIVACVEGNELSWVGWPEGWAKLSDCILIEKATAEQRQALLSQMAAMQDTEDHRCRHAKYVLATTEKSNL